jgi:ubiquinone/menaquinone biosynthesis C-methylase UbiE
MIDFAKLQPSVERIQWQQADAHDLPFPEQTFDVVVCQFGVMFFPDRERAYREALRVLKPGGRFFFNVWDRVESID